MSAPTTERTAEAAPIDLPNRVYYFGVGAGRWIGTFTFRITDRPRLRRVRIGFWNRFLVEAMHWVVRFLGGATIWSEIAARPTEGAAGVADNSVVIRKWGVTLYRCRERYIPDPDGRRVWVVSAERFGPVPFLFNVKKEHPAEVVDGGQKAIYYIPLLGDDWVGRYIVRPDRRHIDSSLSCAWAVATEVIDRAD